METVALKGQKRDLTVKPNDLRSERIIPAVLYGVTKENIALQFDYQTFLKVYRTAGENTIIELEIDGDKSEKVLVHQMDYEPVEGTIYHVDLVRVDMKKEVTTHVSLNFIGQAPAVKDLSGMLSTSDEVEIKCLPDKLFHSIDVNVEGLVDFNTTIHASELPLPEGVELISDPEMMVATVVAPKQEEEPEETTAEGEGGEEGEEGDASKEGEKKEGDAPKEGGKKEEGGDK